MARPFLSDSWYRVAKLRPRLRDHVEVHRHRYRGESWYVLQDHASGKIHRFTPATYLFMARMDGKSTVDEIWSTVATVLGDAAPGQDEIVDLLSRLHAADALQSGIPPALAEMLERHNREARAGLMRTVKSPLAVRIPLWNPDRFLTRTMPLVRPILSWTGAAVWLVTVIWGTLLAAQNWNAITVNLADRLLSAQSILLFALIYPVLKLIHELGHGYTIKRFGGTATEMGIMFLVFFPVPYVDASDATAYPNKSRRMLVDAAGILVEVFIAAVAVMVWLKLEPGMVRAAVYNVMIISGVSTIFFNANPLLRFDGYYLLCDWLEIPNLATRSGQYWSHLIHRYVFRLEDAEDFVATLGERAWFLAYAPAAYVYRLFVLLAIALFVGSRFFVVGVILAVWAVLFGVLLPLLKIVWHLLESPKLFEIRRRALTISATTVGTVVILMLVVPVPLHTTAEGIIWLDERAQVRAGTSGFVRKLLSEPGSQVAKGDPLVEMELPLLARTIERDASRVAEAEAQFLAVEFEDRAAATLYDLELAQTRAEFARDEERAKRLIVRATADGAFDIGQPLDLSGRFLREGELIGYVLPAQAGSARVLVRQDDIELVRHRRTGVELMFADRLDHSYKVDVLREVPTATDTLPSAAFGTIGGGSIIVDPTAPSKPTALERLFQLDVSLPDGAPAAFGSRVYVRFAHEWEPISFRIWRRVRQLFLANFDV